MVKLLSHLHLNHVTLDPLQTKIIDVCLAEELIEIIEEYLKADPLNNAVTIEPLTSREVIYSPPDVKYRIRPGEP